MNYKSIFDNSYIKFESDTESLCQSILSEEIISYDFIYNFQDSYDYSIFIYDNDQPFLFTIQTKSQEELSLIDEIRSQFVKSTQTMHYSSIAASRSVKFLKDGIRYYVGIVSVPRDNGYTDAYVIHSLQNEMLQIRILIIKSVIVVVLASAAVFAFSYFFTSRILQPVKKVHEQQQNFIAAASHEIRNPVNTIMAALEAMDSGSDEQKAEFKNIAFKEGKRLTYLTEDLLTLARLENGKVLAECVPAELDTLIVDCYEAFIAPSAKKEIKINMELTEEDFPKVSVDPPKIKQAISIILSNAIDYTDKGGVIDITYSFTGKEHIITIADSGPGISDEAKPHIFDRFFRADRARENCSHFGLGLSIAMEIISIHKGDISVCDSKYGGAEFIIKLPDTKNTTE